MTINLKDIFITVGEILLFIGGVLYVITAINVGIHIMKNKNDMPMSVYGLQRSKDQVIDKEKFNKVLLEKSKLLFMTYLILGITCIIFRSPIVCIFIPLPIIIDIHFTKKLKKFISTI